MSRRVAYRQSARAEVSDAARWYNAQRRGAGRVFRAAVDLSAADIAAMPYLHPVYADDIRVAPVGRYPYQVYYRVTPTRILILAVRHTARQDPAAGVDE